MPPKKKNKDYTAKYFDNSEISRKQFSGLKRNLISCQAINSEPVNEAKAAIIASYKITQILVNDKE